MPEGNMRGALMDLQGKHMEERKRDVHIVHHTLFISDDKNPPRVKPYCLLLLIFSCKRLKTPKAGNTKMMRNLESGR